MAYVQIANRRVDEGSSWGLYKPGFQENYDWKYWLSRFPQMRDTWKVRAGSVVKLAYFGCVLSRLYWWCHVHSPSKQPQENAGWDHWSPLHSSVCSSRHNIFIYYHSNALLERENRAHFKERNRRESMRARARDPESSFLLTYSPKLCVGLGWTILMLETRNSIQVYHMGFVDPVVWKIILPCINRNLMLGAGARNHT